MEVPKCVLPNRFSCFSPFQVDFAHFWGLATTSTLAELCFRLFSHSVRHSVVL